MARRIYPRPHDEHAETAAAVLNRHARSVGQPVTFPVPIEMIVEQTYALEILWDEIEEPGEELILGALSPRDRRIVLNSRHERTFGQWIGPERFTLAHELAHWVYDADDPAQLTLDLDSGGQRFCYHRETPGLSELNRVRELNANKLAAHLLMPEALVRAENVLEVIGDISGTAEKWQVSRSALRYRLDELGLLNKGHTGQHPFL